MGPKARILTGIAFSVSATLVLMFVVSRFPGMAIPLHYWIFGMMCPAIISAPVCCMLVRQGEQNRRLHAELEQAFYKVRQLADIDQMTGLLNRATFLEHAQAAQRGEAGWFLLIDVDHFKAINDAHGHQTGDDTIRAVAQALTSAVRASDVCGRMGGEEFAVFLPGLNLEQAQALAERVRTMIAFVQVPTRCGTLIRPTVSVGLSRGDLTGDVHSGLRAADEAMYVAKRSGRNRVQIAA